MMIRKRHHRRSNCQMNPLSVCFSTSACFLLLTGIQMYFSMHHVTEYYASSLAIPLHNDNNDGRWSNHDSGPHDATAIDERIQHQQQQRHTQAPRLRDAIEAEAQRFDHHNTSVFRRVVYLETSSQHDTPQHQRTVERMSDASTPKRDNSMVQPFERAFYRDCHEISDWSIRPTCNRLHELSNDDLTIVSTSGSWRTVWEYDDNVIVKRLRYDRPWNRDAYVRHDTDAIAMEKLTSSDFICDMYASCGPSVVTERADDISARNYLKNPNLTSLDRLELARDLATALADVHDIHLMHNDLNMANVLQMNGTLKLNDFNIGIRMRHHHTNDTVCHVPVRFEAPLWKSPEEIRNTSYVDGYAADVYGLGNLLFQVLTKRQPWTHLEEPIPLNKTQVAAKKLSGGLPNLPPKYTDYSGPAVVLGQAVMACFRMERRPTARTMGDTLASAVRYFKSHPNTYLELPEDLFDPK